MVLKFQNTNNNINNMTAKQLAEWILTLPEDIQQGEVTSVVHDDAFAAKRVLAWRGLSHSAIIVNSMGTHLSEQYGIDGEFVGVLNH